MRLNLNKLIDAVEGSRLSKVEISSRCGFDRKTLENVLSGRDPKLSTVISLAETLNLRIGFLFDEEIEVRAAGRDYVEKGKIEHKGPEYVGTVSEADLREQIAQLKSQLVDKDRIIALLSDKGNK